MAVLIYSQTIIEAATIHHESDSQTQQTHTSYIRNHSIQDVARHLTTVEHLPKSTGTTHIPIATPKMADTLPPTTSSPPHLQTSPSISTLNPPGHDEEVRGRKRRRSSNNTPPPHFTSNTSTTLRGRARRRSPSGAGQQFERNRSPSPRNLKRRSPGRKYIKKDLELDVGIRGREDKENRKRSQSPSRSRTRRAGLEGGERDDTVRPRRRQRTTSRSRKHEDRDVGGEKVRVAELEGLRCECP